MDQYQPGASEDQAAQQELSGGAVSEAASASAATPAAPRSQRHRLGSASDRQVPEAHRCTGLWCHKGWGPLLGSVPLPVAAGKGP